MSLFGLIFFIICALAGSYLMVSIKLPAGSILGAMMVVGVVKYFGILNLSPSKPLTFFSQTLLGLMLGLSLGKIGRLEMKKLYLSSIVVLLGIVFLTFSTTYLIYYLVGLNIKEAFLSSTPGGIAQMATLAHAMGLNAPLVVAMHLFRVLVILTLFPIIIRHVSKRKIKSEDHKTDELKNLQ